MSKPTINILTYILDDQLDMIEAIDSFFQHREVINYKLYTDADKMIKELNKDVAICVLDYRLNQASGVDIMKAVKKINPLCYFIIMSAVLTRDLVVECVNNGANKIILKDDDKFMDLLISYLREAITIVSERFETYSKIWENFQTTDELFDQLKQNKETHESRKLDLTS